MPAARTWIGQIPEVPIVDIDAHLTTYMGNAVLRLPTGPIQPYAAGGVGIIKVSSDIEVPFVGEVIGASASDFGWNLGGGVYIFPVPKGASVNKFVMWVDGKEQAGELLDAPKARLVKLRYFAGLTIAQAAEALGISATTAERHWAYARAWLHACRRCRRTAPPTGAMLPVSCVSRAWWIARHSRHRRAVPARSGCRCVRWAAKPGSAGCWTDG